METYSENFDINQVVVSKEEKEVYTKARNTMLQKKKRKKERKTMMVLQKTDRTQQLNWLEHGIKVGSGTADFTMTVQTSFPIRLK